MLRQVEAWLCVEAADVDGFNVDEPPSGGRGGGNSGARARWRDSDAVKAWFAEYPDVTIPSAAKNGLARWARVRANVTMPRLVWRVAAGQFPAGMECRDGPWPLAFVYAAWLRMRSPGKLATARVVSQLVQVLMDKYTSGPHVLATYVLRTSLSR